MAPQFVLFCNIASFFFFKQKTAYEMRISDWSSDVCSSDLGGDRQDAAPPRAGEDARGDRRSAARDDRRGLLVPRPGLRADHRHGAGAARRGRRWRWRGALECNDFTLTRSP